MLVFVFANECLVIAEWKNRIVVGHCKNKTDPDRWSSYHREDGVSVTSASEKEERHTHVQYTFSYHIFAVEINEISNKSLQGKF